MQLGPMGSLELCPLSALREFLAARGLTPGVLFCHGDGSSLTWSQFWVVPKKSLAALGLHGVCFGTYSFQIGVTSMAAVLGCSLTDIKRLGRWRSSCFRHYIQVLNHLIADGFSFLSFHFECGWLGGVKTYDHLWPQHSLLFQVCLIY